ncbi:ABC transporter ATP-binding protein [Paracoccus onubensis]|uniref:ABC transporter ATP-binding protein n=1 Tax=Paracoccus onubensis TaxID=1675788 RepID=UPI00273152BB|nr:ABC transporter ATP-binding protein [Paracoccus onubensis]MDP0926505.1 ABC transporter ATP-binding protein [Paracoccus onubensis]
MKTKVGNPPPLLRLQNITKRYGTYVANDSVDLALEQGQICAILGENGAGKSTLMKTIYGIQQPDEGEIVWNGEKVAVTSPSVARDLGIGMVFQHFSLFETISVVENISLTVPGSLPELSEIIRQKADQYGLNINPESPVHGLSVGERQRVEIIRCLMQDPKLLILDEPTSVLPPHSVKQLFETLKKLSGRGVAMLYISHKLEEIRDLCHSAVVLRQGRVTGTANPQQATSAELARLMIGHDIPTARHAEAKPSCEPALAVSDLVYDNPDPLGESLDSVSMVVRPGEIVGIAGVSGNGQSTLARLLSGEIRLQGDEAGSIRIFDRSVGDAPPGMRRQLGVTFVPEERLGRATVPTMSLADNVLLTAHRAGLVRKGLIRRRQQADFADSCISDMDVRSRGRQSIASSLSGGNLQKFVLGRELLLKPRILIVSQPTWGIDVGAAAMVRQKLVDLRDTGTAILMISEELEEIFEISDRIHVMYHGRLSPSVQARSVTAEDVGRMMMGEFDQTMRAA